MKLLALPKTIGLAGILAGSALVAGGGGLGVAALASAQQAGALSAQLPAVGVREQNVNAAGRIRVALPKGGIGLSGNVSVNNFPKSVNVGNLPTNAAGRVQTQNGTGVQEYASTNNGQPVSPGNPVVLVNVTGKGRFQGFDIGSPGANGSGGVTVLIDGHPVYNDGLGVAATTPGGGNGTNNAGCCGLGIPGVWGTVTSDGTGTYFFPPGGMVYHHSLVVEVTSGGPTFGIFGRAWFTQR
ncbi:MAG: hypothetical protein ACYCV7_11235 [Acidimicrobiales bacterium]